MRDKIEQHAHFMNVHWHFQLSSLKVSAFPPVDALQPTSAE